MELSRATGMYPKSLILTEISMDESPMRRGGFGDVHKGVLRGEIPVAVKVLRIYEEDNSDKALKVGFNVHIWLCKRA